MREIVRIIACLGVILGALAAALGADFTPVAGFEQQLFPSHLIATANMRSDGADPDPLLLGEPHGVLGVDVVSPADDAPIRVTIECEEFLQTSSYRGRLPEAGVSYRIMPKIRFRYDRLARCEQAAPVNVTFRVQVGSDDEDEQTVTCTMRSINDCPYAFKDGESLVDASYSFAAYVNEQHPYVDKLLREALDREVVQLFRGYQANDPHDVLKQAYAIWDVLVARDVRYSSITATAVTSESVICQHVRLLEDSINNSQANCVDGSVLWVSLLRKIGIDGFLVITPDHCYAGLYLAPGQQAPLAIETTLLGTACSAEQVEVDEVFDTAIPEADRYEDSFYSFVMALEHGTQAYQASSADEPTPDVPPIKVVDIADVREWGVLPIPFQNSQDFVGYDFRGTDEEDSSVEMDADSDPAEDGAVEVDADVGAEELEVEDAPVLSGARRLFGN